MPGETLRALSRRERQVMDAVFALGGATVSEVLERLPDGPSYSAIRATLRVLEEKGHVTHEEDGPRYVYRPTVQPEAARTEALQHLVRTFFNNSVEQAAVALLQISDGRLSEPRLERLAQEIEAARREGR
jgi:predicted transcriptional regulator